MRIYKAAMMLPIIGLAALMLMGNTQCSAGGGTAPGAPQIHVGLGAPPAVTLPGEWVRIRGNVHGLPKWAYWPLGGGLLGAAGGKAASWAMADSGGAHSNKGTLGSSGPYAFHQTPCRDKKPGYLLSEFTSKLPKKIIMGVGVGRNPFLDCAGLGKILQGKTGAPARWKYLLDCIANIVGNGTPSRVANGLAFTFRGGSVVVDSANRIIGAVPPPGMGWGQCARM